MKNHRRINFTLALSLHFSGGPPVMLRLLPGRNGRASVPSFFSLPWALTKGFALVVPLAATPRLQQIELVV
jgi:hypothetical protein